MAPNHANTCVILMKLLTTVSFGFLLSISGYAQGIIWSANSSAGNSSALPGQSWQIAFDNVPDKFFPIPPSQNPSTRIFPMTISTNDTGRTFFANAINDPGFYGFIAALTDGANGYLRFQDGAPNSWGSPTEQNFLGRSSLAPDLAGYNITQIGFRVNNFYDYFDVPEDRYFRTLEYSLDFYGVPEPSTWTLLAVGAAVLLMRRKAHKL
jgi:hypothetical protein